MAFLADPERCLLAVTVIAAAGMFIGTLQTLVNWRLFDAGGPLGWELVRTQARLAGSGPSPLLDLLFRFPSYLYLLLLQAGAALLLLGFPHHDRIRPLTLALILGLCLLHRVRNSPHSIAASDTMNLLVFGALALREIDPKDPLVIES